MCFSYGVFEKLILYMAFPTCHLIGNMSLASVVGKDSLNVVKLLRRGMIVAVWRGSLFGCAWARGRARKLINFMTFDMAMAVFVSVLAKALPLVLGF